MVPFNKGLLSSFWQNGLVSNFNSGKFYETVILGPHIFGKEIEM